MASVSNYANRAISVVAQALPKSSTLLSVRSSDVGAFPSSPPFRLTLTSASSTQFWEVVQVEAIAADGTFTVKRGLEGTQPLDFQTGDTVALDLTAGQLALTSQNGSMPPWSKAVVNDYGGYKLNAIVADPSNPGTLWLAIKEGVTSPVGTAGDWESLATSAALRPRMMFYQTVPSNPPSGNWMEGDQGVVVSGAQAGTLWQIVNGSWMQQPGELDPNPLPVGSIVISMGHNDSDGTGRMVVANGGSASAYPQYAAATGLSGLPDCRSAFPAGADMGAGRSSRNGAGQLLAASALVNFNTVDFNVVTGGNNRDSEWWYSARWGTQERGSDGSGAQQTGAAPITLSGYPFVVVRASGIPSVNAELDARAADMVVQDRLLVPYKEPSLGEIEFLLPEDAKSLSEADEAMLAKVPDGESVRAALSGGHEPTKGMAADRALLLSNARTRRAAHIDAKGWLK